MGSRLTRKQKKFIDVYVSCLNATEAARQAGYKGDYATLRAIGSENLTKPNILDEIEERLSKSSVNSLEILSRLAYQARSGISDFLKRNRDGEYSLDLDKAAELGQLDNIHEYTEETYRNADGYLVTTRKVKLYNRESALDKLAKIAQLYKQQIEVTWRTELIMHIKDGRLDYSEVANELGDTLAEELFKSAGVPISESV